MVVMMIVMVIVVVVVVVMRGDWDGDVFGGIEGVETWGGRRR